MRLFLIIILFLTFFKQCSNDTRKFKGNLALFGAEPFTQLALMTEDDERLFIDAEKELLDTLWKENKGRILIEGELYEGEWYGKAHPYIKLEEWNWIEK